MNKTLVALLPLIFCSAAGARPTLSPFSAVDNDPCVAVIRRVADTLEMAAKFVYPVLSATLVSATSEERTYDLRFSNLVGRYEVILDNDSSNKCFIIQQKYIFAN